jgi:hypothetical protein
MKRLLIVAAIAVIAAPALAGPDILPVTGVNQVAYEVVNGKLTPTTPDALRYGNLVWASNASTGYYSSCYDTQDTFLDWGDTSGTYTINGFGNAYAVPTTMTLPKRITVIVRYWADDDGFNSNGRQYMAGFAIINCPTTNAQGYNGWIITVDLEGTGYEFSIAGNDLDGDTLNDFSYNYWFQNVPTPAAAVGPIISGDANQILQAPGQYDAFDSYSDPNLKPLSYVGSWYFGGTPFAQFWCELYADTNVPYHCPNPGGSGKYCQADIDVAQDCIVNLPDLSKLLANYNTTSGATRLQGDVAPHPAGDGAVNLADLSMLLAQYNDNCN